MFLLTRVIQDNNKNLRRSLISIDMQTLGCLVGELLFPEHLRCISAKTDLSSRYTAARNVCLKFAHLIPRLLLSFLVFFLFNTQCCSLVLYCS